MALGSDSYSFVRHTYALLLASQPPRLVRATQEEAFLFFPTVSTLYKFIYFWVARKQSGVALVSIRGWLILDY